MREWNRNKSKADDEEEFMSNEPQDHIMLFETSHPISSIYVTENQISKDIKLNKFLLAVDQMFMRKVEYVTLNWTSI